MCVWAWGGFRFVGAVHGIQRKFSLLPVFVLALLHHDSFLAIEVLLRRRHINFNSLVKASISNVNNINGLSCSEHGSKSLSTLACLSHYVLLPLARLIKFGFTLD